jgi:PAS domain-containing protein
MFVKNAEGRYLAMNGRSAALLKRSPEEVVGRLDSEVFDGATLLEEVRASDREAFRTCQPYVYANTTRVAGAAQTFLSVKLMFPAPVAAIACLSRDVTDLLTASPLHRRSGIDAILRDVAEFAAALERSRIDESLEPPPLGGRASAAARS